MCGLCGMLGGLAGTSHWTETRSAPTAFGQADQQQNNVRERLDRIALVNRVLQHYRLSLKPWSGASFVLRNSTGKTALVDNLSQMWAQAEKMTGQSFDPLDDDLVNALSDAINDPSTAR